MNKKMVLIAILIVLGFFLFVFYDSIINLNPISIAFLILIFSRV